MSDNLVAIYVETPYQLLTSLNIAKNYLRADGCVLFLMEKMYLTDRKFRINGSHPFIKEIYCLQDYEEVGAFRHHLLRLQGILKGYPSKDYPNMCCYYKTKPKRMPAFSALICNKYEVKLANQYLRILRRKADVYVIEDGTGDYVNPPTKVDQEYRRIYYWSELFENTFKLKALKAPQVSMMDIDTKDIYTNIFSMSKEDIAKVRNCRCVYFHQPRDRENDKYEEIVKESELSILNLLKRKFGDSFYIKLHPRDDLSIFPEFKKINSDVPWEVMLYYIKNVNDLVLVGLHSTTLISPKNTFDFEPYVLSTSGIFDYWKKDNTTEFVERINNIFTYLRSCYTDKNWQFQR